MELNIYSAHKWNLKSIFPPGGLEEDEGHRSFWFSENKYLFLGLNDLF